MQLQLFVVLSLLVLLSGVLATVRVAPYNPAATSIGFNPLPTSKRALARPFQFTYRTTTAQNVKDCFEEAGNNILASLIDFPQTITVAVSWTVLDPYVLGSCRPSASCQPFGSNIWYPSVLFDMRRGTQNNCPSNRNNPDWGFDLVAEFNSGQLGDGSATWDFSTDGWSAISPDKFDLVTVILHEMIHGLGFATLFQDNPAIAGDPVDIYTSPYGPSPYDAHLVTGKDSSQLIYTLPTQEQRQAAVTSENVYYFLDDVTPTQYVPILAPNPWNEGASIAHYISPDADNALMNSTLAPGVRTRYPGTIALRILRSIGYTLQAAALTQPTAPAGSTTTPSSTTAPGRTTVPGQTTSAPADTTQDPNAASSATALVAGAWCLLVTSFVNLSV